MPDNFIRDYWPQLVFVTMTLIGFGKGWQLFNIMCRTLKEHSVAINLFKEREPLYCKHDECEKYRDSCATRNERQFNELKVMLNLMDNKRENSRDSTQEALSDIACRISRLETKLEK